MPTLFSREFKSVLTKGFIVRPRRHTRYRPELYLPGRRWRLDTAFERLTLSYNLFGSTCSKWKSIAFARWNRDIGDFVLAIEQQNHVSILWHLGKPLLDEWSHLVLLLFAVFPTNGDH